MTRVTDTPTGFPDAGICYNDTDFLSELAEEIRFGGDSEGFLCDVCGHTYDDRGWRDPPMQLHAGMKVILEYYEDGDVAYIWHADCWPTMPPAEDACLFGGTLQRADDGNPDEGFWRLDDPFPLQEGEMFAVSANDEVL